ESVNFMGELTTNRLWDIGPKVSPSQYARMILGTAAIPPPRAPATPDDCVVAGLCPRGTGQSPVTTQPETTTRRTQATQLLPQTSVDRFTLCQLVAADLVILVVV